LKPKTDGTGGLEGLDYEYAGIEESKSQQSRETEDVNNTPLEQRALNETVCYDNVQLAL